MEYTIDTNIAIDMFRGTEDFKNQFKNFSGKYSLTPIVIAELFRGAYLSSNREESLKLVTNFVKSAGLLNFNIEACKIYGEKYSELKKRGKMTQDFDLLIASIAIAQNSTLITKNKKDFENISDLDVMYV